MLTLHLRLHFHPRVLDIDQAGGLGSDPVTPEPPPPHISRPPELELTDDEDPEVIQVVSDTDGSDSGDGEAGGGAGAAVPLPTTEAGAGEVRAAPRATDADDADDAAAAAAAAASAGEAPQSSAAAVGLGRAAEEDVVEDVVEDAGDSALEPDPGVGDLSDPLGTARRTRHSSWAPPPSSPRLDDHAGEDEAADGDEAREAPSPFLVALFASPARGSDDDDDGGGGGMGDRTWTSDSDDPDDPNCAHLSPAEYAAARAQQVAPNELELFLRLCPYFRGKHTLEEIMYRENLNRAQLIDVIKKFAAVVRTVTI